MPQTKPALNQAAKIENSPAAREVISTLAKSLINLQLPIEFPYVTSASALYIKQEIYATWREIRKGSEPEKAIPKIIQKENVLRFEPFGKNENPKI